MILWLRCYVCIYCMSGIDELSACRWAALLRFLHLLILYGNLDVTGPIRTSLLLWPLAGDGLLLQLPMLEKMILFWFGAVYSTCCWALLLPLVHDGKSITCSCQTFCQVHFCKNIFLLRPLWIWKHTGPELYKLFGFQENKVLFLVLFEKVLGRN